MAGSLESAFSFHLRYAFCGINPGGLGAEPPFLSFVFRRFCFIFFVAFLLFFCRLYLSVTFIGVFGLLLFHRLCSVLKRRVTMAEKLNFSDISVPNL